MTPRERSLYLALTGIAANATRCGACEMSNRIANRVLAEVRKELSYDELVEVGLAPARCEDCQE